MRKLSPFILAFLLFAGTGSLPASTGAARKVPVRKAIARRALLSIGRSNRKPGRQQSQPVAKNAKAVKATAHNSTASKSVSKTASKSVSKAPSNVKTAKKVLARKPAPQMSPTTDRISEIQAALATKGAYLPADPSGKWDDSTVQAMKQFQLQSGLPVTGKIDALTLQKLGLGSPVAGRGAPLLTPANSPTVKLAAPSGSPTGSPSGSQTATDSQTVPSSMPAATPAALSAPPLPVPSTVQASQSSSASGDASSASQ